MAIKGKGNKMVSGGSYLGNINRTKVNNIYDFRTTFSSGYLVPIYASEVLPSEYKSINCAELVRSITPLGPTMDNAFLDIFFFFVPKRLLWDHWEEFIAGYNKEAWAQDVEYTVPKIIFKAGTSDSIADDSYVHSFLDYLPGACDVVELTAWQEQAYSDATVVPEMNQVFGIDALYPRAYVKIWNDWFRSEVVQDEMQLYTGDNDEYADAFSGFNLLSADGLPKACKLHNRITDALMAPLKGPDVLIPMKNLPVTINAIQSVNPNALVQPWAYNSTTTAFAVGDPVPFGFATRNAENVIVGSSQAVANNVGNTIRMLRLATQTELLLSRDARCGTRYVESLLAHFAVHNGDARLQRSEYLGSKQIPLNVQQVTNTAASAGSALGNVGGQSVTKDSGHYFSKSFTEHGIVFGLGVVRPSISYSSGVREQYQRWTRFDHIWPEFKHVGDVPLLQRRVDQTWSSLAGSPDLVYGYTPYGSELREGLNYNNGLFRGQLSTNIAYLTYQEDYSDHGPSLSSGYISSDPALISNTLTVQTGPQFYALFHIEEERIIPLDPTSDPGLMDHF